MDVKMIVDNVINKFNTEHNLSISVDVIGCIVAELINNDIRKAEQREYNNIPDSKQVQNICEKIMEKIYIHNCETGSSDDLVCEEVAVDILKGMSECEIRETVTKIYAWVCGLMYGRSTEPVYLLNYPYKWAPEELAKMEEVKVEILEKVKEIYLAMPDENSTPDIKSVEECVRLEKQLRELNMTIKEIESTEYGEYILIRSIVDSIYNSVMPHILTLKSCHLTIYGDIQNYEALLDIAETYREYNSTKCDSNGTDVSSNSSSFGSFTLSKERNPFIDVTEQVESFNSTGSLEGVFKDLPEKPFAENPFTEKGFVEKPPVVNNNLLKDTTILKIAIATTALFVTVVIVYIISTLI